MSITAELGINVDHIVTKAKLVMNPFASIAPTFAEEADMSGPVAFCLALGFFLSLSGKFQFGVIYGQAITGCVSIYVVLNLMSEGGIDLYRCTSVVGYALLPMVVLSISMLVLPVKCVEACASLARFFCEHGAMFNPWPRPCESFFLTSFVTGCQLFLSPSAGCAGRYCFWDTLWVPWPSHGPQRRPLRFLWPSCRCRYALRSSVPWYGSPPSLTSLWGCRLLSARS